MKRYSLLYGCALIIFAGCGIAVNYSPKATSTEARTPAGAIAVLDHAPTRSYDVVGGFDGSSPNEDEILPTIRSKASEMGGDAVIISSHGGSVHGEVIRYKDS